MSTGAGIDCRAVILGVGVVAMLRRIAADFSPTAMWIVTVLTVPSYLLVHYSSEARGYSYLMFFAAGTSYLAAAAVCLPLVPSTTSPGCFKSDPRSYWLCVILFGFSCVAGCLGHPAFLLTYVALGLWALVRIVRMPWLWQQKVIVMIRLFWAPTLCLGLLWLINLSGLVNSSGPPGDPWIVAIKTLSMMVGGPVEGDGALLVGGLAMVAIIIEMILLARERDDRWVAWLGMIAGPLLLIVVTERREVYPRYYLGAVVFLYVALADLAARCAGRGRVAVIVVCAAITFGNGIHLVRLYEYGRGHASEVVRWIESQTQGPDIVISSDFDFRHSLVLQYLPRPTEFRETPGVRAAETMADRRTPNGC